MSGTHLCSLSGSSGTVYDGRNQQLLTQVYWLNLDQFRDPELEEVAAELPPASKRSCGRGTSDGHRPEE
ncbi:MAG: hypothetical protein R3C17_06155 [Planctomycetaceae bacterium]